METFPDVPAQDARWVIGLSKKMGLIFDSYSIHQKIMYILRHTLCQTPQF